MYETPHQLEMLIQSMEEKLHGHLDRLPKIKQLLDSLKSTVLE